VAPPNLRFVCSIETGHRFRRTRTGLLPARPFANKCRERFHNSPVVISAFPRNAFQRVYSAQPLFDLLARKLAHSFAVTLSDTPLTVRVGLRKMAHQGDAGDRQPSGQREERRKRLALFSVFGPMGEEGDDQDGRDGEAGHP
jgi:hypothetical protein